MKQALAGILGSKKALFALAGTVTSTLLVLAGKYGVVLDPAGAETLVKVILGIVAAYVFGQGVADWGKEKAKIEAAVSLSLAARESVAGAEAAAEADEAPEPQILTEDA